MEAFRSLLGFCLELRKNNHWRLHHESSKERWNISVKIEAPCVTSRPLHSSTLPVRMSLASLIVLPNLGRPHQHSPVSLVSVFPVLWATLSLFFVSSVPASSEWHVRCPFLFFFWFLPIYSPTTSFLFSLNVCLISNWFPVYRPSTPWSSPCQIVSLDRQLVSRVPTCPLVKTVLSTQTLASWVVLPSPISLAAHPAITPRYVSHSSYVAHAVSCAGLPTSLRSSAAPRKPPGVQTIRFPQTGPPRPPHRLPPILAPTGLPVPPPSELRACEGVWKD